MTLDLDELTSGWDCPPGELRARLIVGRDGQEQLQLRVDLGVIQMYPDGRPDGERYRGFPTAREFIEHEFRMPNCRVEPADWQELDREIQQFNYRRMAYATIAEEALQIGDEERALRCLHGALRDIESCLAGLALVARHEANSEAYAGLRPTLVFDRARLTAQLRIIEGLFEEALEEAQAGAAALEALLVELGYDEEQRETDPALHYLRRLGQQLRREYGIAQTLHEQLEEAIENEDFETAARIRDELNARRQRRSRGQNLYTQ
mgnify:CR=1 FL=1